MLKVLLPARTTKIQKVSWSINIQENFEYVYRCGALPIMIQFYDTNQIDEIIDDFDVLMLTGGNDIHPEFYRQTNHACSSLEERQTDALDIYLAKAFAKKRKPILGVCRGMQILNIAFGGTLIQDIGTEIQTNIIHAQQKIKNFHEYRNKTIHEIKILKDSVLYPILGSSTSVNSYHHQCIDQLADSFIISAVSNDGVIEAIEKDSIIGVQWHPEMLLNDDKELGILKYLLKQLD